MPRNFLCRDMKCGIICLNHAAQPQELNRRKCSPTFHESSNISFNISYPTIIITKIIACKYLLDFLACLCLLFSVHTRTIQNIWQVQQIRILFIVNAVYMHFSPQNYPHQQNCLRLTCPGFFLSLI